MKNNVVVVYIEGGCYNGYDSELALKVECFDWDNFQDDPVSYWEYFGDAAKAMIIKRNPELYAEVLATYTEAKADALAEEEQDQRRAQAISHMN
jgi:hypothetical protein